MACNVIGKIYTLPSLVMNSLTIFNMPNAPAKSQWIAMIKPSNHNPIVQLLTTGTNTIKFSDKTFSGVLTVDMGSTMAFPSDTNVTVSSGIVSPVNVDTTIPSKKFSDFGATGLASTYGPLCCPSSEGYRHMGGSQKKTSNVRSVASWSIAIVAMILLGYLVFKLITPPKK